ncbi:MAG: B12-binding domain-containing radical SAM protein [Bacteroidota bacterium]
MKILMIYPEMPDTFYALKHFTKVVGKKAAFPPLGLLTVASMLPEEWERKLVDLNVTALKDEDIHWADYVFLSAMNVQEESVREIIAQCNRNNAIIVAGGPLFTHEHDRFAGIDHFILNEAEITLPPFLEDLAAGTAKPIYSSKDFADVSKTPVPQFELVNMKNYLYSIIQYSRGCPYLCDFCDVTALFGRKPRVKSSEQIIAELDEIRLTKDAQLVLFADDNLIGNKKVLKAELLPALIEWRKKYKPGFYFATQLTVNLADDDELMQLLLDAGFRHVFIGIETPDEASLKVAHKNQNLKRNLLETIHAIHEAGFIISGGFIVGFDTDTQQSFEVQSRFIQLSGIPLPIVNVLKAPPGTELFDRMKKEGRLVRHFAFSEGETNIRPVMGMHQLYNGFLNVIENVYKPKHSLVRLKNFFRNHRFPNTTVKIHYPFHAGNIWIALRVLFLVGILDSDRRYYWNLLIWTLFFNRKFFDKAVFYAVMMYQMKKGYDTIYGQVQQQLAQPEPTESIAA